MVIRQLDSKNQFDQFWTTRANFLDQPTTLFPSPIVVNSRENDLKAKRAIQRVFS